MIEDQLEILIEAIEDYDTTDPFVVLLYIPHSEDDEFYDFDFYFAVLSSKTHPTESEMEALIRFTKYNMGNMIYAAETLILTREEAINHLTSLI
jgi:hypothetical protein